MRVLREVKNLICIIYISQKVFFKDFVKCISDNIFEVKIFSPAHNHNCINPQTHQLHSNNWL